MTTADQGLEIRDYRTDDLPAISAIYRHYAEHTIATFETACPPAAALDRRLQEAHCTLVATGGSGVTGYAYAGRFRPREAYDSSPETTIYLARGQTGAGIGGTLYRALLRRLQQMGFSNTVAVIALPNKASVTLHERLDYRRCGLLPGIGMKFGQCHDVGLWMRSLDDRPSATNRSTDDSMESTTHE